MLPFISLGPLALPTKALCYLLGIWLTTTAVEFAADRLRLDRDRLANTTALGIAVGFVVARIAFVVANWPAFADDWLAIVWPLTAGFTAWAGVLAGAFAIVLALRAQGLAAGDSADALALGLATALIVVAVADFLGGPGYGTQAALGPFDRHPVQLYEALAALAAVAAWWIAHARRPFAGATFLIVCAIYACGIVLVTPFRGNTWITDGGWYGIQIVALLAALVAIGWLAYDAPARRSAPSQ